MKRAHSDRQFDRRQFIAASSAMSFGAFVLTPGTVVGDEDKEADEVSAAEDLMREHGVLNRILLLFEEGVRRLQNQDGDDLAPELFHAPASLVRKFVEDYHEKLEETFIFPEFEKQKKFGELTKVLRQQHAAGRKLTDTILRNAGADRFHKKDARAELIAACQAFIRMYRPHEAREDTVLFPALHKLLPDKRIKELGEQFEKEEDRLFGEEGFEKTVDRVAALERELGIYDLDQFTPKT